MNPTQQMAITMAIGMILENHYPGYLWGVDVQPVAGVVNIKNFSLSGEYGFVLHIDSMRDTPTMLARRVVAYAGELLERYNAPRDGRPEDLNSRLDTDFRGEFVADVS